MMNRKDAWNKKEFSSLFLKLYSMTTKHNFKLCPPGRVLFEWSPWHKIWATIECGLNWVKLSENKRCVKCRYFEYMMQRSTIVRLKILKHLNQYLYEKCEDKNKTLSAYKCVGGFMMHRIYYIPIFYIF